MLFCVVLLKQITSKVSIKVAPHSVYMVGAILCVVVFKEEVLGLDTIIMPFIAVVASGPGEMKFFATVDRFSAVDFIDNFRAIF